MKGRTGYLKFAMTLLASGELFTSCDKDDEGIGGSQFYGIEGKVQVDLSLRNPNPIIGTYYLDSWTLKESRDWEGDVNDGTDLLAEIDAGYLKNELFTGTLLYNRKDKPYCDTESEGGYFRGTTSLANDVTTYYAKIVFKNEGGGTADRLQEMKLFVDSRKEDCARQDLGRGEQGL